MRTTNIHSRRGIAMLLVIVSLMTATVLSLAYLSSRDNSAVIGQNVAAAAASRWTAESGLQMALAVMQSETDWRTMHDNGRLLHDYAIAGGTISVDLLDVGKIPHAVPDATSEHIQITVTASIGGVEQIATALAFVPATPAGSVDVDLSEFAVFADTSITMKDDATLTRWPVAPLSMLGPRVAIGTRATNPSSVEITDAAAPVDTTLYYGPGASDILLSTTDAVIPTVEIKDEIPLPRPPASNVSEPDPFVVHPTGFMNGGQVTVSANMRWNSILFENGARALVHGDVTLVADHDRELRTGSKMNIYDNATIVVFDDLKLDDSSIELVGSNSTLTIFVRGDLKLRDSYIGNARPNGLRDSSGYASPMNSERIRIFSMPVGSDEPKWELRDNSVVKASIYSPDVQLTIRDDSALYGRATVQEMKLAGNGAVFYDPALDTHRGYTNPQSRLYDAAGSIRSAFRGLLSLNPDAVQSAADDSGAIILAAGVAGVCLPADYVPNGPPVTPDGQSTPRTVEVKYSLSAFGSDMRRFE